MTDLMQMIDYRAAGDFAVALFGLASALVFYGLFRLKPCSADRYASIPLSDHVEDPRSE